jgi:hypothetical protein
MLPKLVCSAPMEAVTNVRAGARRRGEVGAQFLASAGKENRQGFWNCVRETLFPKRSALHSAEGWQAALTPPRLRAPARTLVTASIVAELTVAELTVAELTVAELTVAELTVAELTVAELTVAELTVAELTSQIPRAKETNQTPARKPAA